MEHIDEGTIHAWLDGALPAAEGARVEAHVAGCPECAALVAEARGLIAASSRILSALDDVPAGVVPRVAELRDGVTAPQRNETTTRPTIVGAAAAAPRRRPWWQRPQFAAAASIAFIAVAVTVTRQRSEQKSVADFAGRAEGTQEGAPSAPPAAAPAETPMAAPLSAPRVGAVARAESTSATAVAAGAAGPAPTAAKRVDLPSAASLAAKSAASALAVGASPARDEAKRAESAAATGGRAASAPVPAAVAPPSAAPSPAPPKPTTKAALTREGAAADAQRSNETVQRQPTARPALAPDAITRAEKERVTGEMDVARRTAPAVVGATNQLAAKAVARSVTPSTLAGCYRVQRSAEVRDAGLGELVELEFAGAGSDQSRPAYIVRDLSPAPRVETAARAAVAWRWTLDPTGGVTLVRGDGAAALRLSMAIGDAARGDVSASDTVTATRVDCPKR